MMGLKISQAEYELILSGIEEGTSIKDVEGILEDYIFEREYASTFAAKINKIGAILESEPVLQEYDDGNSGRVYVFLLKGINLHHLQRVIEVLMNFGDISIQPLDKSSILFYIAESLGHKAGLKEMFFQK
jgi:hypothetical protein